ncbi:MAG: hypothetical protein COY58_06960 [Gammaproteobacteria bacterium CG_4_10_14_0_8_um_filter_38_16]|nr:MAG: hypothetical protein COY58_06960 [Gammaproteobacteria bacterium CG_4_10_14_0_8_um_filter_38_16]PJA04201.1 MAG: hypothetical protein COX72_01105 [Gammaproteobacteria bacterium CG_4_10_14_0_2_um_filter_38_22]PJB11037.1 MAG: hypothetical protein CO120_01605 [Gammaproteobacteria bacterium CG_4_9_14_3_um_filter_38_9]
MNIHPDLQLAENLIYKKWGFALENVMLEKESQEYAATSFMLNNHRILFRASKITPTKTGQFVTIWKRIHGGPIQPFDEKDPVDFVFISVRSDQNSGQFIFPKKILLERKIFSKNNIGGKRAIRVYAPWDNANSKQAAMTKKWQSAFFVDMSHADCSDVIDHVSVLLE